MSIYSDDDWNDVDMPRRISRTTQEETGLVPRTNKNTFVPPARAYEITSAEQALLSSTATSAGDMIARRQMHTAHSEDTAVTHAVASLIYSAAYIALIAAITIGIVLMAIYLFDGNGEFFALAGLIGWGWVSMRYLKKNRAQGLWHSSTGIAHHEIDSRESIAKHAIDRHAAIIEKRLGLHHDPTTDD